MTHNVKCIAGSIPCFRASCYQLFIKLNFPLNLNTHSPTSLYKAFPPEEARRLAERFEWHYTPKHGSWLDMAEIEVGIMSRQALAKPLPDLDSFKKQVRIWTIKRNAERAKISWQFKTQDARIKLARL